MCEIVNTLQFRFPAGSPRPSYVEIANFLKRLSTDPMMMDTAYKTANDRSLFVKFKNREAMMETREKNTEMLAFAYSNGESVQVQMCIAGTNMQYVRIFDLPPELSDDNLSLVLGSFGKVERVVREKFPADSGLGHINTGVRGVYIDVKNDIPPSVNIGNRKGRVFYNALKDTCFLCHGTGHRKDSCPQRTTRKEQKKGLRGTSKTISYADIVSGMESTENLSETVEDDIVEILEEEEIEEPIETLEEAQVESPVAVPEAVSEKERRRKEGWDTLEEVAKAIQAAMTNPQANQRRADFAGSRSSSGSGSAPRKKCARRTNY